MLLIYTVSVISFIAGFLYGIKSDFRLARLNRSKVLNTGLFVLAVFAVLMVAWHMRYLTEALAVGFMMVIYCLFAGFFFGYGRRLSRLRSRSGWLLYVHRSFLTDHAPGLAAILLILYGIYRTSLLGELPVTGIRLTSGLSIIAAGFTGWLVKPVPEFKSGGILLIDNIISWDRVIAWSWQNDYVLNVDYLPDEKQGDPGVQRLSTTIPEEDRLQIETVLKSRMEEFRDERARHLQSGQGLRRS